MYSFRNVVGLHKAIAAGIIKHASSISPKELRFLRTEIGMTQAELAMIVKKDHQTVGRWERGETIIDQNAEALRSRSIVSRSSSTRMALSSSVRSGVIAGL